MDKKKKMLTLLAAFLVSSFFVFSEGQEVKLSLMPVPAEVIQKEDKFRLTETFTTTVKGPAPERLSKAAARMLHRLSGRTGIFFTQGTFPTEGNWDSAGLGLRFKRTGQLRVGEDESYTLTAAPGRIEIAGETDIGVLRGLETFLQLVCVDEQGYFIPALVITDRPRFPWRGLLIDVCRHFQPIEVIKRNLDGMSAVKMNVLHWHLSEDQGFRVECKTFPKLHQSGSDGFYYTHEQIREVIAYAADRGIRVMPEFDIPGHSTSWLVGYPELASAAGPYSIERRWGIFDPTFNPSQKATYKFFKKFFAEMAKLFPDEYMHIGGDENNGKQWNANPRIQAFMKKKNIPDNHALQAYFNKKILDILSRYDKKMIGWDEIFQPGLPKNIVIHSWRGQEALIEAAKKGYPAILSNGYYIDLVQSTAYHYLNDPIPADSPLSEEEKKHILGGEATMWGELISPETIDSRIWPRTAAIAERLWSPGHIKDVEDMYLRLEKMSLQLEEVGLLHRKNQAMMMRRLTGGRDTHLLKMLVDVIEPLKGYNRHQARVYTQFSPLTRVVDVALPDAKVAREFRWLVDRFISILCKNEVNEQTSSLSGTVSKFPGQESSGAADAFSQDRDQKCEKELRNWLVLWKANHKKLKAVIDKSPILKEIETLSEDLSRAASIGIEALDLVLSDKQAGESWAKEKKEILRKAAIPRGQTELMILTAIEKLVDAVKQ